MRIRVGRSDWELRFNARVDEDEIAGGGIRYTARFTDGQWRRLCPFIRDTFDWPVLVRRERACDYSKGRLFNDTIQWIEGE